MSIELFGDQRKIGGRPLHMFLITDESGSMGGEKIQTLNTAIRESVPAIKDVALENPTARIYLRAITFSSGANLHIPPTPVEDFQWQDIDHPGGVTDMGKALNMVADALKIPPMEERALPPVLILISDGHPTDDFNAGLKALLNQPWGKKSIRIAIEIGKDADESTLQKFIGHPELKVLRANKAEEL
ncbi:MAG: VWA domain-containing protein, partial [Desulfamplus sp.]|nr:VWA domain-containing protein [Desulfamplus sp.]